MTQGHAQTAPSGLAPVQVGDRPARAEAGGAARSADQRRIYARWAPVYDALYRRVLAEGQRRAAEAASACGPRILEAGIGTGLTLSYYGPDCRITGIDLSEHMLRRLAQKVRQSNSRRVRLLAAMDACRLGFPGESFDAVTVPFVISLVPQPEAALSEFARVLRIGGEIAIANKIGADGGMRARMEELADPLVRKVGWSCAFKLSRITEWAKADGRVDVVEVVPLFPAGLFKLVRLRRVR